MRRIFGEERRETCEVQKKSIDSMPECITTDSYDPKWMTIFNWEQDESEKRERERAIRALSALSVSRELM